MLASALSSVSELGIKPSGQYYQIIETMTFVSVQSMGFLSCWKQSGTRFCLILWPVNTVVGGFHLLDGLETDGEIKALAQRLKARYPQTQFYTSHCTDDNVFKVMKGVMGEHLQSFCAGTINEAR